MDDRSPGRTECAHCGVSLSGGRFCTNCGARIGTLPPVAQTWPSPSDTAERRYDVLEQPPPVAAAPAPAATAAEQRPLPPILPPPPPDVSYQPPFHHEPPHQPAHASYRRQGPGAGLWVGAAAVLLVVLLLGGFLLLRGTGGGSTDATDATTPLVPKPKPTRTRPSPSPSSPASSPASSTGPTAGGPATNVAGLATATSPVHAPSGVDFAGRPVSYVAPNMVDGVTDTCWRTVGDATGTVLTFRLDRTTRLTRVGLINGYAKIAYDHGRRFDWYLGTRRVLAVDWEFDDGTTFHQTFGNDRVMQQSAIRPVTTDTVRLRITSVSPPGKGRAARDYTAISEVLLIGRAS